MVVNAVVVGTIVAITGIVIIDVGTIIVTIIMTGVTMIGGGLGPVRIDRREYHRAG